MVNIELLSFSLRIDTFAGNLIYLDMMGQPAVLVNSREVANDLMDKRSSIYSDRPFMVRRRNPLIHFSSHISTGNGSSVRRLCVRVKNLDMTDIAAAVFTTNSFLCRMVRIGETSGDSWPKSFRKPVFRSIILFRRNRCAYLSAIFSTIQTR
jgi:hypothetical protein